MGYKVLAALLSLLLAASLVTLAGCAASDGEEAGESDTGKIELPVWPDADVSAVSAPEVPASSAESAAPSVTSGSAPAVTSDRPTTSNYTEFTENSTNAPDISNITVCTSQSYYSTSDREITVEISNRTGWEIGYKQLFVIEKWDGENWIPMPTVENPDYGKEAYILGTGRDSYITFDLDLLASRLEVGKYRVGLPEMLCNGHAGLFTLYAEFSVK